MLTISGVPISVHTRKTLLTAVLKDIDHQVEPVIPFSPPPTWDELSPTGLIPVMQGGDFILAESTAICLYLERKHPAPAILPADPRESARALFFDGYAGHLFRSVVHGLFFQKVISPLVLKGGTDQSVIDATLAGPGLKAFAFLESQATGRFLVADRLTLADIAIVSNLINYQYLGFAIEKARYPGLARYVQGIVELAPFRQVLAGERPFAEQMQLDRAFLS